MYPVLSPQLTNFAPDRQPSAAPLRPLAPADPALTLIASVLREGLMRDGRTFDPIVKPADGSDGWRTRHRCLDPEAVAVLVMDPAEFVGPRHRHRTRLVAIDLDNHDRENWRPDSPRLIALQAAVVAAGAVPVLVRTPNGMHLWLALPEAVPIVRANWQLRVLLQRAEVDSVEVELFPSLMRGTGQADPRLRTSSNGIRLPGQAGSALWVGDRWVDDPVLIWQELEAALELAEVCPAWDELQEAARVMEADYKAAQWEAMKNRPRGFLRRAEALQRLRSLTWSSTEQSNDNLSELSFLALALGYRTREAMVRFMEQAALKAPGFEIFASMQTKRRLSAWCGEWADYRIRKAGAGSRSVDPDRIPDPGRNARLSREAFCSLLAGCERAAREFGEAAFLWSARKIAEYTGIARTTLSRLMKRFHWQMRLLAILYRSRSEHPALGGSDPPCKGVMAVGGCSSSESINQSPPVTADPARCLSDHHCRPPSTADPPPMPTRAATVSLHSWQAVQRSREREELARWLAAA
jgi:hypothetical protein